MHGRRSAQHRANRAHERDPSAASAANAHCKADVGGLQNVTLNKTGAQTPTMPSPFESVVGSLRGLRSEDGNWQVQRMKAPMDLLRHLRHAGVR